MAKFAEFKLFTPKQWKKQLPFAASRALNDSAFDVRKKLAVSLSDTFTIRNKWTERGLRVQKANKRNLEAIVGMVHQYAADHIVGARRDRGTVPTSKLRQNPKRIVRRGRWPGALLNQGAKHFVADARTFPLQGGARRHRGRAEKLVFQRRGKKRKLRLMWIIPQVPQKIDKRWAFKRIALEEFGAVYAGHLRKRLREASQTMK